MPRVTVWSATEEIVWVALLLAIDIYRVLYSSFLAIFVTQQCPAGEGGTTVDHVCSLTEQVTDLTVFNNVALGLNGATAIVMLIAFADEFVRERWMIKHLRMNEEIPMDALNQELKDGHPILERKLFWFNIRYIIFMSVAATTQVANIVVSGILVFRDYYGGLQTACVSIGVHYGPRLDALNGIS